MSDRGYLLDTSALNEALKTGPGAFVGQRLFVTHIQRDELSNTPVDEKRNALLEIFTVIGPKSLPTESAAWNVSKWDQAKWSSGDGVFKKLFDRISELDRKSGKKTSKVNRQRDALIAETALKNDLILVTNDGNLAKASREANVCVFAFEDFLQNS